MQIILQPLALRKENLCLQLGDYLSKEFNFDICISQPIEPPDIAFNKRRNQWRADDILRWILDNYNLQADKKILVICDMDAYSIGMTFVFGLAHLNGCISLVFLSRLRQEFYGLKPDESLLFERTVKTAVHELGHVFGVYHCENVKCVMHYSKSVHDTDIKEKKFCDICETKLKNVPIYFRD